LVAAAGPADYSPLNAVLQGADSPLSGVFRAGSAGSLLEMSSSMILTDIPACDWLKALARAGGPMVNDLAFEMIYKLCVEYIKEPPAQWFGAITSESK
jgi:hypothetical protein